MGKFLFLVSKVQEFKGSKVQCFGFGKVSGSKVQLPAAFKVQGFEEFRV
jgi:hypothetical protein